MELLILTVISFGLIGVIVFQAITIRKITEDSLDRLAQKQAGIYYPKYDKNRKDYKEEDKNDSVPLEDVSDEDFLKAVKGGING